MLVSQASYAILLVFRAPLFAKPRIDCITATFFKPSPKWRVKFEKRTRNFYHSYLAWFHQQPIDLEAGRDIMLQLVDTNWNSWLAGEQDSKDRVDVEQEEPEPNRPPARRVPDASVATFPMDGARPINHYIYTERLERHTRGTVSIK
jgi:hypothetical protein